MLRKIEIYGTKRKTTSKSIIKYNLSGRHARDLKRVESAYEQLIRCIESDSFKIKRWNPSSEICPLCGKKIGKRKWICSAITGVNHKSCFERLENYQ